MDFQCLQNIFLKLDDDVLLNVMDVHNTILRHLHNQTEYLGNIILGYCISNVSVNRNTQKKWGVSREVYPPPTYPRYCYGLSYALTKSTIPSLLNQTHSNPLIHLEDVSVGLLAHKAGNIKLINILNWKVDWNSTNGNLDDYRKDHTIHTRQGKIDKVVELWQNIFT